MVFVTNRRSLMVVAAALALGTALTAPVSAQQVTITYLQVNTPDSVATAEAQIAAFEAANPDINVELETRPGGADGDNIIKTRLATSDMTDVFSYNSGSLFQALNPATNLLDLSNEPWQDNVLDSFKPTVTAPDGTVRGAPSGTAMGGGIFYNKLIYAELGLTPPKTWADFMANNEKIKAAGKVPVIQSFGIGSTWTSQLFVLGDFFNVQAAVPTFAADYTAGKAKYASTPAAVKGFQYGEDVFKAGYLNEDFAVATFEEAVVKLATGEGAHYPMLTFAVSTIGQLAPENLNDVGFFAIPGDDAATNGMTVWMPGGTYIAANTDQPEAAKRFVAFLASPEACQIDMQTVAPAGPFLVEGCQLPDTVAPAVADLQSYFNQEGTTAPALEFVSPIKGPNLEQITVEVGSGIRSAAEAAALYDEDVRKQAMQLGLPGWN
jgi:raffinose/stachyose/melibiose transport system substrate-binding protein